MTAVARERLAVLAHEVRSPVAALGAIAETYRVGRLETAARRRLVELAVAACRGNEPQVTDATLASVRLQTIDIGRLVEDSVAAAVLAGGNVRAEVGVSLLSLDADPIRLRQALDNLVWNAREHASSKEILVRARRAGTAVLISVADDGPGVPVDDQERIFEAGARLATGQQGSGLGLAVARAVAEAHGGTLTLESVPGEGATFTIELPIS
ncbi:MAG: HAMP domain-containing histidine kinase [Actinomycetota bacterium]|nr:HAMP domain-containing histidine kinase [Actinomycetota bacterium]